MCSNLLEQWKYDILRATRIELGVYILGGVTKTFGVGGAMVFNSWKFWDAKISGIDKH